MKLIVKLTLRNVKTYKTQTHCVDLHNYFYIIINIF